MCRFCVEIIQLLVLNSPDIPLLNVKTWEYEGSTGIKEIECCGYTQKTTVLRNDSNPQ